MARVHRSSTWQLIAAEEGEDLTDGSSYQHEPSVSCDMLRQFLAEHPVAQQTVDVMRQTYASAQPHINEIATHISEVAQQIQGQSVLPVTMPSQQTLRLPAMPTTTQSSCAV